jgi:hypothetical protein
MTVGLSEAGGPATEVKAFTWLRSVAYSSWYWAGTGVAAVAAGAAEVGWGLEGALAVDAAAPHPAQTTAPAARVAMIEWVLSMPVSMARANDRAVSSG